MNQYYLAIYDAGPTLKQHWVNVCIVLRTSMKQEYLTTMSIKSDILRELDFSSIISDFAIQKSTKVSIL